MTAQELSEVRKRAWETRRVKYGPKGHSGAYSRFTTCSRCERMESLLCQLRNEGLLTEGQIAKATGLHRIRIREICDDLRNT